MSQIIAQPIRSQMEQSYLDYAMSVITDRALPDVRDGLKPVHRRILHAMHESGSTHNKPYKKSARMVGDVIGKYHPHGDTSVYGAAVRMAQPFAMAIPLIDGQGNFGSIDGDNPAAMRYTEMRMARIASEMFADIGKETVSWRENYDGSEKEPTVLPVPYPNLLVNGVEGIAVGMASSMPPHNLGAVIDATLMLMDRSDASTSELLAVLQAPDFPTGAIVHSLDGFVDAIEEGRGRVKLRSKWHEESRGRSGTAIVIDELPYQVNKADLVARIAELVRDKEVEDITGLRDESSKEGVRVWIGLKRDASAEAVFSALAAKTNVEVSVNYNCTVLVDGKPRQLGLRQIITEWIAFREEVVLARHIYERKHAMARLHILEAFIAALGQLDAVIATIRSATEPAQAKQGLIDLLTIDAAQAQAILDLKLQRLTGMEIDSIRQEHATAGAHVVNLTEIIESPQRIREIIRAELAEIKRRYAVPRRTEVGHDISEITREDLIPREDVLLMMTAKGYVKRMPANALERQNRGGRGRRALEVGDDDALRFIRPAHSHDSLMVFTKGGKVYGIKAYKIPEGTLTSKGRHIRNVIEGLQDDEIHVVLALPESDPALSVVTVTMRGEVKRTALEDYAGARRAGGLKGMDMEDGDQLVDAFTARDGDHLMLISSGGNACRFDVSSLRVSGRTSGGVRGMRLEADEHVLGAMVIEGGSAPDLSLLCLGSKGLGKRTLVEEFRATARGTMGMVAMKLTPKTGDLVAALGVREGEDLVILTHRGVSNRTSVSGLRPMSRATAGVSVIKLDEGDSIASVSATLGNEDEADPATGAQAPAGEASIDAAQVPQTLQDEQADQAGQTSDGGDGGADGDAQPN